MTVRLVVIDQNGTLLDGTEVTREEFIAAQNSAVAALALLGTLSIGTED